MKTFRFERGHEAGKTMTVAELKVRLADYPEDMPVMTQWEGVRAYIQPENFEIALVSKGHSDDECEVLVIDVNEY